MGVPIVTLPSSAELRGVGRSVLLKPEFDHGARDTLDYVTKATRSTRPSHKELGKATNPWEAAFGGYLVSCATLRVSWTSKHDEHDFLNDTLFVFILRAVALCLLT